MEILQEERIATFPEYYDIGAFVLPIIQGKLEENPVQLEEKGILNLSLSERKTITGFRLGLIIPKEQEIVIVQRNQGHHLERRYHRLGFAVLSDKEWSTWIMTENIRVYRKGGISWTVWQATVPNRIDLWSLTPEGLARLFQVGVIVRGEGDDFNFRLLGELRGEWQLAKSQDKIVGTPTQPVFGPFQVREIILKDPEFQKLLEKSSLPGQEPNERIGDFLEPPIEPGSGVMEWWNLFMGTRGQGPCFLHDKSSVWVCGEDVLEKPNPDGIVRLPRGTPISYEEVGTLPDSTARKLLRVRRLQ